eukprot:g12642.t1
MSRIMSRALSVALISAAAQDARAATSRGVARAFFSSRAGHGTSNNSGRPAFVGGVPAVALYGGRGVNSVGAVPAAAPAAARVCGVFNAKKLPALSTRGGGVAMMSTDGLLNGLIGVHLTHQLQPYIESGVSLSFHVFVLDMPINQHECCGVLGWNIASASMSSDEVTPVPNLSVGEMTYTPEIQTTVSVSAASKADSWEGDMLVLLAFQQEDKKAFGVLAGAAAEAADKALDGVAVDMISMQEFKGEKKGSLSAMLGSKSRVKRIAVVGLGKKDKEDKELTPSALEAIGTQLAALAKSSKCKSMGVVLPEGCAEGSTQALAQGALVGLYADKRYKSGDDDKKDLPLQSIDIIGGEESANLDSAKAVASGVSLCRDLVNSPPNMLTPAALADAASKIAKDHGLECEILEEEEIKALGMGAYMGVAQGAVLPPKFIHLTYKPSGPTKKKVALLGKGVTFDSGGYNIKAGAGSMIELMKFDMGGSACTLGAAKAIAQLKPDGVEAHFIVAACENMISEKAVRPGDILTASNGKTIEVINTDAEGRLTLADALVFAEKLGVDAIIDSATLTGACLVALGNDYGGLWSSDDDLAKELNDASEETGEKLWRMPLAPEYGEQVKSKIADLKNVGARAGSAITAALFLKEFVGKTPWAHLDIPGPVWNFDGGGATGYGVRLLTHWVQKKGE